MALDLPHFYHIITINDKPSHITNDFSLSLSIAIAESLVMTTIS